MHVWDDSVCTFKVKFLLSYLSNGVLGVRAISDTIYSPYNNVQSCALHKDITDNTVFIIICMAGNVIMCWNGDED